MPRDRVGNEIADLRQGIDHRGPSSCLGASVGSWVEAEELHRG
jgi:hypothetical protein